MDNWTMNFQCKGSLKALLVLSIAFLSCLQGYSQELVKDINDTQSSLFNQKCVECAGLVFFVVDDEHGAELWKTDGTEEGTSMVIDLYEGSQSGVNAGTLNCLANKLYFIGKESGVNYRVYASDGTATGTTKEADIPTLTYTPFKDKLVIAAGLDLWLDDLNGNTFLLKHFEPETGESISFEELYGGPSNFYTIVSRIKGPSWVMEIWISDGTESGTQFVKSFDLNAVAFPQNLFEVGSQLFFAAGDVPHGKELWTSDGTESGTAMVEDLVAGSSSSNPAPLGDFEGKLVFSTTDATYITDGSSAGTTKLIDYSYYTSTGYRKIEGGFLGIGYDHNTQEAVFYKSNGTLAGTEILNSLGTIDYSGGPTDIYFSIQQANGKYILPAATPALGIELYYSLGEINDLTLIKDIRTGSASSRPETFVEYGDQVIFIADDGLHGNELWVTDGTPEGTNLLKDTRPGTESSIPNLHEMFLLNQKLLFAATNGAASTDIWISDGTTDGTKIDIVQNGPFTLQGIANSQLFFTSGKKLFSTNGNLGDVSLVYEYSGIFFQPTDFDPVKIGDAIYFIANTHESGMELWRLNTLDNTFSIVKDIWMGTGSALNPSYGVALGEEFVFWANDGVHGPELWITDESTGAHMIKEANAASYLNAVSMVNVNDMVYFSVQDGALGFELWETDGTSENTTLVKDINIGATGSNPTQFQKFGDKILFLADDGMHGWEPWVSDGTEEGTEMLKDINPTGNSGITYFLSEVNGKYFFAADDGIHGMELWATDGTEVGTTLYDLIPGAQGSDPKWMVSSGANIFFTAGGKLWGINFNDDIGQIIGDFEPASQMYVLNDYLFFKYETQEVGVELFKVPISTLEKMNQEIEFLTLSDKNINDPSFEISATSNSGLEVDFSSQSETIELENSIVSLISSGHATIVANQPGNTFYKPAPMVSQQFCINPAKPIIIADFSNPAKPALTSSSPTNNYWFLDGNQLSESNSSITASQPGLYSLKIIAHGCESEFSEPQQVVITGVDTEESNLAVYPNPTKDVLHVSYLEGGSTIIQILSSSGTKLLDKPVLGSQIKIDVSALPSGIYLLKIISKNETLVKRWVKE